MRSTCTIREADGSKVTNMTRGHLRVSALYPRNILKLCPIILYYYRYGTCIQIANRAVLQLGYRMMALKDSVAHHRVGVAPAYEERRRFQRIHLQVPLLIRGKDAYGEQFLELAKTLDISANGAFLTSPRPLSIMEIVILTIPAPSITSSALVPAGMPPIQAKVKRSQEAGDVHLIGVEFTKPIG
jgi:hypothetical protein